MEIPLIVAFFGPDGAGKTSIAHRLAKHHRVVSIRGTHTLASAMAQFLGKLDAFRGNENPYYKIRIPEKMRTLWTAIESISVFPHIVYKFVLLPKFSNVFAERSIPDFVAWVVVTSRNPSFIGSFMGTFLLTLCRRQSQLVYVTAAVRVLRKRRPESAEFIEQQVPVYDTLAKFLQAPTLDTSDKTIEESVSEILGGRAVAGLC